MRKRFLQLAEVLLLRTVPGLLNLFALTSAAHWLGADSYGIFSTGLATSGAVASLVFGPITFSVLATHAKSAAAGNQEKYEGELVSLLLMAAAALLVASSPFVLLGWVKPAWVAAAITFGIYTGLQEIHHARLGFVRFALAATLQAALFVSFLWMVVEPAPSTHLAVWMFAFSYAFGALCSFALSGFPLPVMLRRTMVHSRLRTGIPLMLNNLAGDSYAIGFRYLILAFGSTQVLGVFSFCVDLAQRLIGVVVNLTSFALIPRAFKEDAKGKAGAFHRILRQGAVLSLVTASIMVGLVLGGRHFHLLPVLNTEVFDTIAFSILAAAVVLHRTGKLILQPIAMRADRAHTLMAGFLVAIIVGFALGSAALIMRVASGVYLSFLAGFVVWLFSSATILRSELNR